MQTSALKIQIIIGSTREGRAGEKVGQWVKKLAETRRDFTSEYIDLKDWALPFLTDPMPPSMGKYASEFTRRWSKKISGADGYIFVTPEYNHGYSAVLKNALDHVYQEWNNKPAAFVSYGGGAGGARAVEQLRQVAVELQMAPIREQVAIPIIWEAFDEGGMLKDAAGYEKKAEGMFGQLVWWARALKAARENDRNV